MRGSSAMWSRRPVSDGAAGTSAGSTTMPIRQLRSRCARPKPLRKLRFGTSSVKSPDVAVGRAARARRRYPRRDGPTRSGCVLVRAPDRLARPGRRQRWSAPGSPWFAMRTVTTRDTAAATEVARSTARSFFGAAPERYGHEMVFAPAGSTVHRCAVGGDRRAAEDAVDEYDAAVRAQQEPTVMAHGVELAAARLGLTAVTALPHRASPLLQAELTGEARHDVGRQDRGPSVLRRRRH